MLHSRLGVKVEGDEHPDSMVLSVFVSQTESVRLLCFPSAPPVHASRKSESGGVVMPISMKRGWRSWSRTKREVAHRAVEERCCKL